MLEFKLLNKEGLEDFINSNEFNKLKILPITKHRAISHINNPRADKADILLILAFDNNQLAGYLGILPDFLFPNIEKSVKCGWLSCIWVDPLSRGKRIGEQLIRKSLEVWSNKILSADLVPLTKKIYDKTNAFSSPIIKTGIRLYYRVDLQTLLPPKNRLFQKTKGLLKACDYIFNSLFDIRYKFYKSDITRYKFEYCNQIDDETEKFIPGFQDKQLFKRGVRELNWIINYPWIIAAPDKDYDSQRYYFSSVDISFDFYSVKVRNDEGQLAAFFILSKRNHIMKLPYFYAQKDVVAEVVRIIEFHIIKWRINTFTTFHSEIVKYLIANKTHSFFKKRIQRQYLVSIQLINTINEKDFDLQDGDGDCAFT